MHFNVKIGSTYIMNLKKNLIISHNINTKSYKYVSPISLNLVLPLLVYSEGKIEKAKDDSHMRFKDKEKKRREKIKGEGEQLCNLFSLHITI